MPIKRKIKIDIDNGHSDAENRETDPSKILETPVPKKRKRDQTILYQTAGRPKNAKRTATTKRILSNELGPEPKKKPKLIVPKLQKKPRKENKNQVTDNYAPVPLPSAVVSLFQGPHRFPKETEQECLFSVGIPPTIFYVTQGNTKLLEPVNFLTTDKLNNMVRSQKKRKSLMDMTLSLTNNNNNNIDNTNNDQENLMITSTSPSSTEKQLLNNTRRNEKEPQDRDSLEIKKDGTIYVKLDGRSKPIMFPPCRINFLRLPDFET